MMKSLPNATSLANAVTERFTIYLKIPCQTAGHWHLNIDVRGASWLYKPQAFEPDREITSVEEHFAMTGGATGPKSKLF